MGKTAGRALLLLALAPPAWAQDYEPPRTASGRPDLQGYWTNAALTTMQRAPAYAGIGLVIPEDRLEALTAAHPQNVRQATDDNQVQGRLPDGTDLARGRGYNAFWVDPGSRFGRVRGEARTSWIIHPEDGRIPFSERGEALRRGLRARLAGAGGPEGRSLGERCIIGFGGTGGPPMNNVLYNNLYQIVQTDGHLVILVEMVHDARIIPIGGGRRPEAHAPWLGDSTARWEGDTLVVETVNLHPRQAPRNIAPLSARGRVTERLTRVSDRRILYEFEVDDPVYYTGPWRGEMSFSATDARPYEYVCHEGNYGLRGILAGARRRELARPGD